MTSPTEAGMHARPGPRNAWRRRVAVVLTASAVLAGCGHDDEVAEAVAPTPVPAPAPAPPVATAPPVVLQAAADVGTPLPAAQLDAVVAASTAAGLAGAARCDVQIVDITYTTLAPDGVTPTVASGAEARTFSGSRS